MLGLNEQVHKHKQQCRGHSSPLNASNELKDSWNTNLTPPPIRRMLKQLGLKFCPKAAARWALMDKLPIYFLGIDYCVKCLERHPPSLQYGKGQQSQQPSSTSGVGSSAPSAQRAKRRSSAGSQNRKQGPADDEEQPDSKKQRGRAADICPASGRCKLKDGQTHCRRCCACTPLAYYTAD